MRPGRRLPAVSAALVALAALATPAPATILPAITQAEYAAPTTRYDHAVLGDAVEWGALRLRVPGPDGSLSTVTIRLPESRVFEDTAPRLVDIDGDGAAEVMVVETDLKLGARLAIYGAAGLIAATPFIGRANRWLAPLGAADLDGDGQVEIAWVDRPHLARIVRVWRFERGRGLVPVAELAGFTNHRIGEDYISGGIRDCGTGPELILADAGWKGIYAVTLAGTTLAPRKLGPFTGIASFTPALSCKDP